MIMNSTVLIMNSIELNIFFDYEKTKFDFRFG